MDEAHVWPRIFIDSQCHRMPSIRGTQRSYINCSFQRPPTVVCAPHFTVWKAPMVMHSCLNFPLWGAQIVKLFNHISRAAAGAVANDNRSSPSSLSISIGLLLCHCACTGAVRKVHKLYGREQRWERIVWVLPGCVLMQSQCL